MKTIRLDGYHDVTITDAAFTLIQDIVKDGVICGNCQQPYTQEYPCVAINKCLQCFLKWHENKGLAYIGQVAYYSGGRTFSYSDTRGYIYLSHDGWEASQLSQSNYWTLKIAGFPIPEEYNGQKLYDHNWYIKGDFQHNSVIVIEFKEDYGDHRNIYWIASKDGTLIEINKRRKVFQKLFKQAREYLESTHDKNGYHVGEYTFYQVYDSHLFTIVSDLLSADTEQLTQLQA